jgi:hypothetical protein
MQIEEGESMPIEITTTCVHHIRLIVMIVLALTGSGWIT